nr:hypothetical protein [bacterium]
MENALRALAPYEPIWQSFGFAGAAPCSPAPFLDWLREASAFDPSPTPFGLEHDPRKAYPFAGGLLVLAYPYTPFAMYPPDCLQVPSYYFASQQCYHAAPRLAEALTQAGLTAQVAHLLPQKPAAYRSGAGFFGKNGLFHWHGFGSRVVLAVLAIGLEVPDVPQPHELIGCGPCLACMRACPAKALAGDGSVDENCLRRHMLSIVPEPLRPCVGLQAFGCDRCQATCPATRGMATTALPPGYAEFFSISGILADDNPAMRSRVNTCAGWLGKNYVTASRLRSAAALAAGNTGDPKYLPLLLPHADSPSPAVREHARWAISRLSSLG